MADRMQILGLTEGSETSRAVCVNSYILPRALTTGVRVVNCRTSRRWPACVAQNIMKCERHNPSDHGPVYVTGIQNTDLRSREGSSDVLMFRSLRISHVLYTHAHTI